MDLAVGSTVDRVMSVGSRDDEGRRLVGREGRARLERDVNVRRQSTGDYPDLVQVVVRASVDIVFGVGAGAVVGDRVARCRWSTGVCGHVPMADRSGALPPQFVDVPIGAAVGHLMLVVMAGVVGGRIAGSCRRAGDASQVVVANRAGQPIQPVNVPIGAAIHHNVVAGVRVDEGGRVAGGCGRAGGCDVLGAWQVRALPPQRVQVLVFCSVDHNICPVLLDESERIAGRLRRAGRKAEGVASNRASRPVEAVHMVVLAAVESDRGGPRRVDK